MGCSDAFLFPMIYLIDFFTVWVETKPNLQSTESDKNKWTVDLTTALL